MQASACLPGSSDFSAEQKLAPPAQAIGVREPTGDLVDLWIVAERVGSQGTGCNRKIHGCRVPIALSPILFDGVPQRFDTIRLLIIERERHLALGDTPSTGAVSSGVVDSQYFLCECGNYRVGSSGVLRAHVLLIDETEPHTEGELPTIQ